MTHEEASVWANLRLDKIQSSLGIPYQPPDLQEIGKKLQDEATDKEEYSDEAKKPVFIEFFSEVWVMVIASFRDFLNRLFATKQSKSQNHTTDKRKDKTDDV